MKRLKLKQVLSYGKHPRCKCYIGNMENTPEYRQLVKILGSLLRPWGKIQKEGRGKNRKHLRLTAGKTLLGGEQHVPHNIAPYFCVYFRPTKYDWQNPMKDIPPYWKLSLSQLQDLVEAHELQKDAARLIRKATKEIEAEIIACL